MTRSTLRSLLERHGVTLLAVVAGVLAVVTLLPGLGRTGLWDPWEMDRAHVARQMVGAAGVAVLEPESGALAARLAELGEGRLRVESAQAPTRHATSVRLGLHRLRALRSTLAAGTYHLALADLGLLVPELSDEAALREIVAALSELQSNQPGLRLGLDVGALGRDREEVRAALVAAAPRDEEGGEEAPASAPAVAPDLVLFAGAADPALAELVAQIDGAQWWRAQFRDKGELHSLPILDFWLVALSYELFGFNELAARLPFVLWGLLGLLVVVLATRSLFGARAAAIAALVLVTTPFYVGAARHVSGEISFTVTLTMGVMSFLVLAQRGWRWSWFAVFLAGALLGFLSNGLSATLFLWVVALTLVLATGRWRRGALVPLGVLTVLFAGLVLLVLVPGDWSFFSHFKFMDRLFQGGPAAEIRSFDYLVRQIGFAAFPWSALLPFALARAWRRRDEKDAEGGVAQHGVVLWFAAPLFLGAILLRDFSHCVYPGIPALAVALGVFLDDLLEGDRPNGFVSFVSFLLFVILAKQIGGSAEPVAGYLTYDPHFDPQGSAFPEEVAFPSALRYLALLAGLAFLVFGLRLGRMLRRVAEVLRRPGPLGAATFSLLVVAGAGLVGMLMWRFEIALSRPEARSLELADRLAVRDVMLGPLAFVLYGLLAVLALVYLFAYSEWGQALGERRRGLGWASRLRGRVRRPWFVGALAAAFVVAVAALFLPLSSRWAALAEKLDSAGATGFALLSHNPFVLVAFVLGVLLALNRLLDGPLRRGMVVFKLPELFERPAPVVAVLLLSAFLFTLGTIWSVFGELSLHVSQKHIVDSYLAAEGREELGDNIFKHGSFAETGQGDANFYTNGIPEIADRNTVLAGLLGQEEVTVRVAGAKGGHRDLVLPADGPGGARSYFLLPKKAFSEINHVFRKRSEGRPIPLLDAASSRLILAVSELREGESDENWITAALTTEEEMRSRDWFPDSDGDVFRPVYVNWDDQIELLGYVLEREKVSRRQNYNIKMFFRCKSELRVSYKIFMHVDRTGSSHRIHSDHWPLNLEKSPGDDPEKSCRGCFQTRHWLPGDIYVDSYGREVPLGAPSGPQDIWIGFYNPTDQKRLKVKDFDEKTVRHDGQDRVRIGAFDI